MYWLDDNRGEVKKDDRQAFHRIVSMMDSGKLSWNDLSDEQRSITDHVIQLWKESLA